MNGMLSVVMGWQLWNLSNLCRFSFTTGRALLPRDVHKFYDSYMLDMLLEHCPNLEDLHIPGTDGIARLFLHAWWPHLKRLSFGYGGVPLTKWNDLSIQTFLEKHQTLERLCLPNQSQATWSVNRLPNLKALDTGIHPAWLLMQLLERNSNFYLASISPRPRSVVALEEVLLF
jgi:hypothetical protein